jgi:hypothetical protein
MDSLYYDGYDYRKESLDGPQPQTFKWIFTMVSEMTLPEEVTDMYGWRPREERRLVWPSFPHWLESSDNDSQYCIMGKAGSGKSTLMAWISRDQQEQTVSHLRKWAGSRPVHILTHFLFRPSADALGRDFEGLLRSLLFQVLSVVPTLQTSVFDGHAVRNYGGGVTKWSVRVLKEMLKHALHSTQQRVFCIFIDGVDEFQNDGYAKNDFDGLMNYLLDLQQPGHIKLCVSSRPTVKKLTNLPSVSGTTLQLTDLNQLDIHTYVSQVISHCDGLKEPDRIVREVCRRAYGVFLWAVFAVQEIIKWADTEDSAMLLERLESMGTQLEEIFAYMLGNVEPAHRKTLALYVKAMEWSRTGIIERPPSVALLVAAQEDVLNWSHKKLRERCELEKRRITQWSHGLLEIANSIYDGPRFGEPSYAWVRRTSQDIKQRGQRSLTDTKALTTDWIVSKLDHDGQRVAFFGKRYISWLHRSAFDFFFSPASQGHTRQTYELLKSYDDYDVTSALIQGYRRLMLTLPHGCTNPCSACLVFSSQSQGWNIIHTVASATTSLGECHDDALDQLLTTILAWRHHGAHPEPISLISDYQYHQTFSVMYPTDSFGCHSRSVRPTYECIKGNCSVRFDLDRIRRDGVMEQATSANDACNSIRGTLSEAIFWKRCAMLGVSFSYIMRRITTFHERRAGGVILACILEASQNLDRRRGRSADSIRFETHVLDQLQLWFNHHAPAPVPSASCGVYAWTYINRAIFLFGPIISSQPRRICFLTLVLDASGSGTESHEMSTRDYSEVLMMAALTSVYVSLPYRDVSLRVGQLLAPWDVWIDIGGRRGDIAIMVHVTKLALINSTQRSAEHNDIVSLRLMLGNIKDGRIASHEISHDITRKICGHDTEFKGTPTYEERNALKFDGDLFLAFAEDLLRDVHQNPNLPATEKEALENALRVQLVDHAIRKVLGGLVSPSYSWYSDQAMGRKMSAETKEKINYVGQVEQARLMALLSARE